MGKTDPAATVAGELKLLLRSYPEVSLSQLAAALQGAPAAAPPGSATGHTAWDDLIEPVLRCAEAFGNPRLFASKREALRILSDELGVPASWTNLHWNQLPSIAAAALLRLGPGKADEIAQRYRLSGARAAPRSAARTDAAVEATIGIIHAKHT